jgi:diguanylate cyclase (GGDEF)-like protein
MSSGEARGVMSTKRSLIALSHAMERSLRVRPRGEPVTSSLVIGLFQRRGYFERERHRYEELAAAGATCVVAFRGDVSGLPVGVHGVELAPGDPYCSTWALVVLDGSLGTTLVGQDAEDLAPHEGSFESARLFTAAWSFSRADAARDADRLLDHLAGSLPAGVVSEARLAMEAVAEVEAAVAEERLALVTEVLVGSLDRAHLRAGWLRQELDRSRRQSELDPMTGLYNRRYLDRFLAGAGAETPATLASMLVDVDDLKGINDIHGHEAGDAAIVAVADTLSGSMRPHDVVCRIGGDEFLVLMPGLSPDLATAVADRTVAAVHDARLPDPWSQVGVDVSIGVAVAESAVVPVGRLDEALYDVKRTGKGRASLARPEPHPT